ncbi:MAG TPA: helix-turn-helix transcriptional regulator [Chloroflexota bacterium]|nr:helix-turn-helix transcriptional regulator [Chloroflexota bacterium]
MVKLARLRAVRERKPMTQEELAKAAGINRVTIAKIESGRVEPYPATVRKIAAALDVQPFELMGPEEEDEVKALAA